MNNWWETPSNKGFLSRIVDEAWKGNIVLVYEPEHIPSGLYASLKRELGKRDIRKVERISLNACDSKKLFEVENIIHDHFSLDSDGKYVGRNVKDIFDNIKNFYIGAIIFEKIPEQFYGQFNSFIDRLRRYLLSSNPFERPKIICFLDPNLCYSEDIPNDVGLTKILYQQVFDKLDFLLGITSYLDKWDIDHFGLNNLVISYISVFDYSLAEELSELPELFFGDLSFLEIYNGKYNWEHFSYITADKLTDTEVWERWACGILERKDDKLLYHPGFLKIKGKTKEINKRIWNAELEILLPLIENLRFLIVENPRIEFPDEYTNKITRLDKSDKYEFEIGEISFLMDTSKIKFIHFSGIEKNEIKSYVRLCKEIRNCLAHMRNVNIDDLKSFVQNYSKIKMIMS
ncbi:hypothetical protein [Maribellus sediminis]|uniref:hypothetical protein n=1 Tax=Maribellus sediminis TaxID=2696285 RepID=UPI00143018F6|nr:hypothetical protein [Maribellus sediminis]